MMVKIESIGEREATSTEFPQEHCGQKSADSL
jgi:hypothetical protein